MWKLIKEENNHRTFVNTTTNSQSSQVMAYVDPDGNKWWSFEDMAAIPFTRQMAATSIQALYTLGLSKDDLSNHINGLKKVLKSDDKEKYEKAFAMVIDFETKSSMATDAIKQISSMVCIYNTLNDEEIDSFDKKLQLKKMSMLEADVNGHVFFLKKQTEALERYNNFLNSISQTASQIKSASQDLLL